ncbi:hypothetical protein GCM10007981_13000 [Thermocladium modestius]|uniref:Uncharacterized protein n=1 Tax=Thermocladium modestius TaxID=62609 RepID=A0A830GV55_9CREN|nr:hypothetical protein [Thermocladium modestius]GGP21386.1 hypothetical protein GCM10007981_13000 [Thermocladium modestius]
MIDVHIFASFRELTNYLESKRDRLRKALEVEVNGVEAVNVEDGSLTSLDSSFQDDVEDVLNDVNSMLKRIKTSSDYTGIIVLVEEDGSPSNIYIIPGDLI